MRSETPPSGHPQVPAAEPAPADVQVPADPLFSAPGTGPDSGWQGIDRRWRTLSWLVSGLVALLGLPLAVVLQLVAGEWLITAIPLVVAAVLWLWNAILIRGRWPRWGYAETADELWVRHGVMFRSLSVVPYGRLQVIDVNAGPLERAFGLATVTLVTASARTDARIPGLPTAEAARLRDKLTSHSEPRRSGL